MEAWHLQTWNCVIQRTLHKNGSTQVCVQKITPKHLNITAIGTTTYDFQSCQIPFLFDSLVLLTRLLWSSQFTWNPSKAWLLAFLTSCLMTASSTRCRKSFRPGGSGSSWLCWKSCSVAWYCGSVWVPLVVADTVWTSASALCTALVWQPLWSTSK